MFTIMACARTDLRKCLTRQSPEICYPMLQIRGRQHVSERPTHSGNVRAAKSGQRKYQGKPGPFAPAFAVCMVTNDKEKLQ